MATPKGGKARRKPARSSEVVTAAGRFAINPDGLPTSTPDGETVTWVMNDKPERLAFGFVERGDRIVWSSFAMLGGKRRELSARAWRTLELAKKADVARGALVVHTAGRALVGRSLKQRARSHHLAYLDANAKVKAKRTRGTHFTREELEHFAALYREGLDVQPGSPLKYVHDNLGTDSKGRPLYKHRSSAQRRVEAARRAGLLGKKE